jgi:hypothetical protein
MSVRLPTNALASGQPINLTVILRNTTTNEITLPGAGTITFDLFVLNSNRQPLAATNRSIWLAYSGPSHTLLPGRSQTSYHFRLDNIFDLGNPGRYYLYAKRQKFDWAGVPEVISGTAEIAIQRKEQSRRQ